MIFDLTSFLIYSSVIACGIAGYGSAIFILKRVINKESIFFSLFLIGATSYVVLYVFLKIEALKVLHYPLQTVAIEIAIFGFFMFSYSLKKKGEDLTEMAIFLICILLIPPILCFIFLPFIFIIEPYGYELQIEPWFLALFSLLNMTILMYACGYLLFLALRSPSIKIRKKIKIIVISLIINAAIGMIFLAIIPVFFQMHDIKPIGYYLITVFILIMVYAFRRESE
ncbi:MAG: hypothetical protein ACFFDN_51195 [Candidatus Hodarchaeota archaeon]